MKYYYDPEYMRTVDEAEVRRQYDFFKAHYSWFTKSYEQFKADNFIEDDSNVVFKEEATI